MEFGILGPLEVRRASGAVTLGGVKPRAVLAVLLLHPNEPVHPERLALALWGDDAPASAAKTVQVYVSRLRKALGDAEALVTTPAGYRLRVRAGELDAERFAVLVEDGRRALETGEAKRARDVLSHALGMWRGPALAELAFNEFAQPEIARLEEQRLAALEARVDAQLQLDEHAAVIGELEALIAHHPGRERLAAQLMLALYRCGRQGDALQAYARTRTYLSRELGLEPGPALKTLQGEILSQSPALQHAAEERVEAGATAAPPVARASAVTAEPIRLELPRSLRPPARFAFVGRQAELARLHDRWEQMRGGACAAVVVGGEPGIGKTRLASELAKTVHEQGALVLYGHCDEGLAVPYQPFVEALRPYARAVGLDRVRAELGNLAAELGRLLPELALLGEPPRRDPQSARLALFEAVAALIEAATRRQPGLLVLDDLHWAAPPTLLLLRHLLRCDCPLSGLVLCTYRETELDPGEPLAQLLADLQRDASAERVSLSGLDEAAIAALVKATVGQPPAEHASWLVHELQAQTAGNPFFLRELLAHLADLGEGSSPDATTRQVEISDPVRDVISHRVARLSPCAARALRVAAVTGPTFSFGLLERVLGERGGVLDALDEAVAAGLLTESEHGDYTFAHALVRQTLYDRLGSARRIRLHRQLGEALERLGNREMHVQALAHHFAQAAPDGQGIKAADYALAAGRSATARLGYEEAAAHYQRGLKALTMTGQPDEQRRCQLQLALGDAHWGAGELDNARQAYQEAAELADKLDNPTALARAALGFCGPHRFELSIAVTRPVADLLQRALTALDEEETSLRARLMGRMAIYTSVVQPKSELAHQALEMARRVADKATLADVLASALWAASGPDTLHESLSMARKLGLLAEELGDVRLRALAHISLLEDLLQLGDIHGVDRELEALQQLAETRGDRYVSWYLAAIEASHAHLQGRLDSFERLAHEALAHSFQGHDENAANTFALHMLYLRREQGRLDEVVETVEGAVAQTKLPGWRCALALIYAQLGRFMLARRELETLARADFRDVPRNPIWLASLSALCEVVVSLDDAPRARLLYELLLPYADRCVVTHGLLCHGSAARLLGLLATTLARYEDAQQHFEHALAVNTQIRAPLWIAHTQHGYAGMLLLRNHSGDRARALQLLTQALVTAEQHELKALDDQARALKLSAQLDEPSLALPRPG